MKKNKKLNKNIDTIIFEGGGVAIAAYGGVLKKLNEINNNDLSQFKNFMGTSAGSIVAALLALDVNIKKIDEYLMLTDYDKIKTGCFFMNIYRFFKKYGWFSTKGLKNLIKKYFKENNISEHITFSQLPTDKNLYITVSNLNTGKSEVWCKEITKNKKIIDAIVTSCSIPFVFEITKIRNRNKNINSKYIDYCDGGLLQNYNIEYFNDPKKCIGFMLGSKSKELMTRYNNSNVFKYGFNMIKILYENANKKHISKEYWDRTIFIDTCDISSIDFDISYKEKLKLFDYGYKINLDKFTKEV